MNPDELQQIDPSVFVHPTAQLYGRVAIGAESDLLISSLMSQETKS